MKPKVIIEVSGGCVRDVSSDAKIDVMIIDYDVQGFDESELIEMPFTGDKANCSVFDVDVSAKKVRNLYDVIKKDLELSK